MKILLAADGSSYTKKALAFLVNHEAFGGAEVLVLHVEAPLPPRAKTLAGASAVAQWQRDEAQRVLSPIERFLERHAIPFKASWKVGYAPEEIVRAAESGKADMIVMGTHGYGLVGRIAMGSVAQKVVTLAKIPVLLVK